MEELQSGRCSICLDPPTNAVDDEKDAKKLDKAVEASQKTEEVAAAKAVA